MRMTKAICLCLALTVAAVVGQTPPLPAGPNPNEKAAIEKKLADLGSRIEALREK